MRTLILLVLTSGLAAAQAVTPLWSRGYSIIPAPRSVQLGSGDLLLDSDWSLDDQSASPIAARSLTADWQQFYGITLRRTAGAKVIRLAVVPGTVRSGQDAELDAQAYRLRIAGNRIEVTGNAAAGLFYGVQSLIQLPRRDGAGRLLLPEGVIEDWPRLQLRFLHWDTKHHQNRMETLKRYLDWSARFKINMIGFELEDKFQYPSNPEIGAPGAYTPAELQQLVDYGLERHIQIVPVIQAPAHMAYVLKHPKFAHLRADGNNYQSALCDPRTYQLIFSMYDDVIKATQGVKYLFVSTDENYYAGIEGTCRPYNEQNRSLAWVEFVKRARDHAARMGRRILIWDEYPLLPEHVSQIPSDIIAGVIGESEYLPIENRLGIRQLAYVSMQGSEYLFPDSLTGSARPRGSGSDGRLAAAFDSIANGRHWQGKPIGAFGAAWDDSGLHDETFWLGWSAVAQWAWSPGVVSPPQHAAEFMRFYYGPRADGMIGIYRAMERQAQGWQRTWDSVISRVRGPGYGNSEGKGIGTARHDLTLSPPPLPQLPGLSVVPAIGGKYARYLDEARARKPENDELLLALHDNLGRVDRNRYNLEVLLALAEFMGHHWRLLGAMAESERDLIGAQSAAGANQPALAIDRLVAAYTSIERQRRAGEKIFANLTAVFEMSRYPKGRAVGGRQFVHVLDDTKDHFADRTADLGYMMAPERQIGLDGWLKSLHGIIQEYAREHNLPVRGIGPARLEE